MKDELVDRLQSDLNTLKDTTLLNVNDRDVYVNLRSIVEVVSTIIGAEADRRNHKCSEIRVNNCVTKLMEANYWLNEVIKVDVDCEILDKVKKEDNYAKTIIGKIFADQTKH